MKKLNSSTRLTGLCIALLCIAAMALRAQSTTQGAIGGTAEDSTGAVVANAKITIHNDGTNAEKTVTTDQSGFFNFPLVEPGTYTVTIAAPGFGLVTEKQVIVQVGQPTTLAPRLTPGNAEQTVNVSADAVVLNFDSPDVTAVLTRTAIDNIPIANRRWSALAMTTPGVVADSSGFGLISIRGMSTLLNNVEIDGADDNDAYYSEERGRTREAYSTASNAVQEFEVNTGVYSAQYGRAAGGVINSVTKSGTNQIHGELFFNDLDRGFGAYDPGSVSPFGAPLKPKDLRKIYGGSLGGALIKDKLFWFYTYDQMSHINPAIAKAANYGSPTIVGGFLEQPDATVTSCTENTSTGAVTVTGANAHTALDGQVCALAWRLYGGVYTTAVAAYNNGVSGTTGLLSDLGTVPRVGYQEINTPKLDWQINSKERFSVLYHRLRWDAPGDVQTTSAASYSVDAFGNDFVKVDYGLAKLESQITSTITNEALFQYSRELLDESQQPFSQYTLNNLVASGGTVPYIGLDTSIGFNMGSPYYSYRQALPDETKYQIEDILYYSFGNHSIRVGGDYLSNTDFTRQEPYYNGYYNYTSLPNYLTDLATKGSTGKCNSAGTGAGVVGNSYDCYSYAYQDFGATAFVASTADYAGFIQDNWKVTPRLTLELGVRYDYESIPGAQANLVAPAANFVPYAGLLNHPSDKNNIGPRIGFAYDLFGTGKTVLRGGYGLYYGRVLNGAIMNTIFGTGSTAGQYQLAHTSPSAAGAPTFPSPFAAAGAANTPSSFYLAPNLQNPQVDEFDLNLQQQLGRGTVMQIGYLGAFGRTLPNFLDTNWAPPQMNALIAFSGGPLAGLAPVVVPTFSTCTVAANPNCTYPTGYINPNFTNITEVISNVNSSYNGLTFDIANRSIHGLTFDANYVWSHALDFNQNASSGTATNEWLNPYASQRQNYGTSAFNVGNRFVAYALYNFPGMSSGGALKYLTNGWSLNDSFQMQNGLPYSAQINSNGNSTGATKALNTGSWNGSTGAYYIPLIGLNTYEVPRAIVDDLRLQKEFAVSEKYRFQLNADMYNVANHQNFSTSDVSTSAYNFSAAGPTFSPTGTVPSTPTATLVYIPKTAPNVGFQSHSTSNDSGFLYIPREFQVGARLEF
jgi:outer membrane receptor protein involved in Fe transport